MSSYNDEIIAEFRANDGKVGGPFAGGTLLLLTSKGAKSGKDHTTPVMYQADGERWLIFASYAGAPKHPAWYHNLVANPDAVAEIGAAGGGIEQVPVRAVVIEGAERDRIFAELVAHNPGFGEYQAKTSRVIPVVALERRKD